MMNPASGILLNCRCVALLYVLFAAQQNQNWLSSNSICRSSSEHKLIIHQIIEANPLTQDHSPLSPLNPSKIQSYPE